MLLLVRSLRVLLKLPKHIISLLSLRNGWEEKTQAVNFVTRVEKIDVIQKVLLLSDSVSVDISSVTL